MGTFKIPLLFRIFLILRDECELPIEVIHMIARNHSPLYIPQFLEMMKGFSRDRFSLSVTKHGLTWYTSKKNIAQFVMQQFGKGEVCVRRDSSFIQLCIRKHTTNPMKFCVCCLTRYETGYECSCFDNKCGLKEMIIYRIVHLDLLFCVSNLL
jgi:hypothetical protein